MIDSGVYQLIDRQKQALGLIGGLFPSVLPEQCSYPVATYREVGGNGAPTLDTAGMQRERWQFDIYSASVENEGKRSSIMPVYWKLRSLLEGFQGFLPDGSYLDNVEHIQRQVLFDDASRSHRVMCEFYLYFTLP